MCDPDSVRPKIKEGITRTEADSLFQQRDRLLPATGHDLAPSEMGECADVIGICRERELIFGSGVGKQRGTSVAIERERPLRSSAQYLAFDKMQKRAARRCR